MIKSQIHEYVQKLAITDNITDDIPLLESGIIDSLDLLQIVNFTQEKFGIEIKGEEIIEDNFSTLYAMACFIEKKLSLAASP